MKRIRIVSPAKHIDPTLLSKAATYLHECGLEVEIGEYASGEYHYFSGTIEERKSDFQAALDDEKLDVILCARGGYGSLQLVDDLDYSQFLKHPKLIIGYSDITVFHNHINAHYHLPTVHATAPLNFEENSKEALASLVNVINGNPNEYRIEPSPLNLGGEVEAVLVGGNLAILYALIGTDSDIDYTGKILFIEEIGEAIYALDRMFYALKKSGKLNEIAGLIVGGLTAMKDSEKPFGLTAEEVIYTHVKDLGIPVCFNFPAGHIDDNRAIILGKKAELSVQLNQVKFIQG